MKKVRKGFTLIELLIVVAIIGALSAMMAASSSESIDASAAAAILNNLQTMKTAAFEMYMERADIASLIEIANNTDIDGTGEGTDTVGKVLGTLLGRVDIATNYGIVGDGTAWYVYYTITASDTANVKTKLKDAANKAGLLGAADAAIATLKANTITYYDATDAEKVVALKVR